MAAEFVTWMLGVLCDDVRSMSGSFRASTGAAGRVGRDSRVTAKCSLRVTNIDRERAPNLIYDKWSSLVSNPISDLLPINPLSTYLILIYN